MLFVLIINFLAVFLLPYLAIVGIKTKIHNYRHRCYLRERAKRYTRFHQPPDIDGGDLYPEPTIPRVKDLTRTSRK